MKNKYGWFLGIVFSLVTVLSLPMQAAVGDVAFGLTGTAHSTNVSWAIVPIPPGGGQAKVTSLSGITDVATGGFKWYTCAQPYPVAYTSAAVTTSIPFTQPASPNNITNTDIAILYQPAYDRYTRILVASATYTNIVSSANTPYPLAVGDVVWKATAANNVYKFASTNVSTSVNGYGGILYGAQQKPLLIEVTGNGDGTVSLIWASGEYIKP
jgi:hypothetical protein